MYEQQSSTQIFFSVVSELYMDMIILLLRYFSNCNCNAIITNKQQQGQLQWCRIVVA